VLEKNGRVLTKESMHRLLSELFNKALEARNTDAIVANGPSINDCKNFASQIAGRDSADWEVIYIHDDEYPPVLLTTTDKESLASLLLCFSGTSAEAVYKILADAGAYS
jgi:hypothetical protein